jgi:predicted phage tail protein
MLSWSYPSITTAGRTLPDIRRIVVYRYTEELPPSATATPRPPADRSVPDAVAQFANVPTIAAAQFARLGQRVDSIEGANLAQATVGARLTFEDTPAFRSVSGRPVRVTYGVVTESATARSQPSNLVSIVPLDVAVAPVNVVAAPKEAGVTLSWTAPATAATGGKTPVIVGYNIYRDSEDLATPVNPSPIADTSFTDAPPYGTHTYRVTAVASAGPPRVESEPSAATSTNFRDLVAPPPPASISPLVETTQIRIVWDAVDATDLAGYKIYRAEGYGMEELREAGKFPIVPLPMTDTRYVDPTIRPGISFRYEVTSVDKSGNESKPISTPWVLVPRTP